ncbi:MAG: HAMP domain-containing protein [Deltaproteobacteria bacterium]|nr:HAMP domain-containing protein [Deltaproteobacteria bacterium]
MSLKKKILFGYGVAFILMGLVVAWAVSNLVSLGQASDAILRENYRSILAAENMIDALERQDSAVLLMFLGDPPAGRKQFRENEADFLGWLVRAKDNVTISGEEKLIQTIASGYTQYRERFSDWSALESKPAAAPLHQYYREEIYPLFAAVRSDCLQLRRLNETAMYTASQKAGSVAGRAIWSTVTLAAVAVIIALFFSLFLSGRIARPLRLFMEAARTISSGDYAVRVPAETRDELGLLAEEFNRMTAQLERYHEMNIDQIISEKQKGEAILASIEEGLVVFDTGMRVTAINPAARRLLNLEAAEILGKICSDILPPAPLCELIRKTIDTGGPPAGPEEERLLTLPHPQGPLQILFAITIIGGGERSISGIVLLLRDITRLKEVERLKSEFVMAASHELYTPLTSLGMSIDLLREGASESFSAKDRELLQVAHEEVQRLKALVRDLLDLSKMEAGKIVLELEEVSLADVFKHIQEIFKGQLEMKAVRLSVAVSEDPLLINADANKIAWVLTNLVSNALRYVSEQGGISLKGERRGSQVRVAVQDNGPGIPSEAQARIFQKFVQLPGRAGGGTGLGLAICKEIVRAHGGTIWVESSPGSGSTFFFTLPAAA